MNIGKEIALEAKKYELCQPWSKRMLKITQFKDLVDMYFKGDDWSMKNDFPRIDTLRKYKGAILPYHLYVDDNGHHKNLSLGAFFGTSKASLSFNDYDVSKLIVRHNSKLTIVASGRAIVNISLLDGAEVQIDCIDDAKVLVFDYGKNTRIICKGQVKIIESNFD